MVEETDASDFAIAATIANWSACGILQLHLNQRGVTSFRSREGVNSYRGGYLEMGRQFYV